MSVRNLQSALRDLARLRTRVGVRVRVRFKSEICKLHMHYLEIVRSSLQVAQIYKSCVTTRKPKQQLQKTFQCVQTKLNIKILKPDLGAFLSGNGSCLFDIPQGTPSWYIHCIICSVRQILVIG